MNKKTYLLCALLAAFAGQAMAADGDAGNEQKTEQRHVVITTNSNGAGNTNIDVSGMHMAMSGSGMEMMFARQDGKLVKAAPYAAESISETVQNLSDGNQISHKSSTMHYRDKDGRTRTEMRNDKGEVRHILISDRVEGVIWNLDPQTKTANKMLIKDVGMMAGEAAKAKLEAMKKDGKLNIIEKDGDGHHVMIKRVERDGGATVDTKQIRENVEVRVAQSLKDLPNMGDLNMRIGSVVTGAFGDVKWAKSATTKDLGSKTIEGVKADGKLRSYEIPAGELGNRNAIIISDESWYSPELQITVYTKHSDPRSGERIYRLASLKRDEPAASLFTVPSDYTVKESANQVRRVFTTTTDKK